MLFLTGNFELSLELGRIAAAFVKTLFTQKWAFSQGVALSYRCTISAVQRFACPAVQTVQCLELALLFRSSLSCYISCSE